MRVHFLRHGESASNAHPGAVSLPDELGDRLTERGWEQARRAGPELGAIGATRILTSPLRRARETTEAVNESLGLPVTVVEELRELRESDGYGELAPEEQRLRRWSNWMADHGDDPDHSHAGGESFNDLLGRVHRVQELLLEAADERVIAVSHGIFLRFFFVASVLGDSFHTRETRRLWQLGTANCGLCVFEHREPDETRPAPHAWRCLSWMAERWDPAA